MRNVTYGHDRPAEAWTLAIMKIAMMAILGVGSFVFGISPMKLAKYWQSDDANDVTMVVGDQAHQHHGEPVAHRHTMVSLMLCFGGGALMCTTVIHLQPEIRQPIERMQRDGHITNVEHLADLIVCAGFFLMLFLDQAAHSFVDWWSAKYLTIDSTEANQPISISMIPLNVTLDLPMDNYGVHTVYRETDLHGGASVENAQVAGPSDDDGNRNFHNGNQTHTGYRALDNHGNIQLGSLFTIIALSLHECVEGVAVGLEKCEYSAWYLCMAITMHKIIIAFCIGLEMVYSNTRRSLVHVYMFVFSATTPLGIAIGMLFQYGSDGIASPVMVVLQGLAAGTLLYVVYFEILNKYIQPGFAHVSAILFGFVLFWLLLVLCEYNKLYVFTYRLRFM